MMNNYKTIFTHNLMTNETTYESRYKNKILKYEIIFGKDPYSEILYFFSLHRVNSNFKADKSNYLYTQSVTFYYYKSFVEFENNLFKFLLTHRCDIL